MNSCTKKDVIWLLGAVFIQKFLFIQIALVFTEKTKSISNVFYFMVNDMYGFHTIEIHRVVVGRGWCERSG